MRHDEGLGGWTPLLLVQSVYALWDAVLLSPPPPPEARGPCPAQGYQYGVAVYHYTRSLALAARCAADGSSPACSEARTELQHLQVSLGTFQPFPFALFTFSPCPWHVLEPFKVFAILPIRLAGAIVACLLDSTCFLASLLCAAYHGRCKHERLCYTYTATGGMLHDHVLT